MRAISYHKAVLALQGSLTVRSVFERAWQISSPDDQVLTLTTARYDGPLGVRIGGMLPAMAPGRQGLLRGTTLLVGQNMILLASAEIWTGRPTEMPELRLAQLQQDRAVLEAALSRLPPGYDLPGWRERLASGSAALGEALVSGDASGARTAAIGLLGLGPGLTPAGDDVLLGLLAGLTVLAERLGLPVQLDLVEPIVLAAPSRTTALSCTLLTWAGRGVAAQPLLDVLWSLGSDSGIRGLDALVSIGHTSGRDMLQGATLAVSVILEREKTLGPALGGAPQRVSRLGEADARLGGARKASRHRARSRGNGHTTEPRAAGG